MSEVYLYVMNTESSNDEHLEVVDLLTVGFNIVATIPHDGYNYSIYLRRSVSSMILYKYILRRG